MSDSTLDAALYELDRSSDEPSTYSRPFLAALPVSGVAVSTVGDVLGSETISASDVVAARVDELQFDLGEGPCWDVVATGNPVLEPDLRSQPHTQWPAFSRAILEHPVSSLFAFPIAVGSLRLGAVDLYSVDRADLDARHSQRATVLAEAVGRLVLRRAVNAAGEVFDDARSPMSRRVIHQATGMVLAQLRVSSGDALLIIQGHAFAGGRSMMEVAQDILDGRLSFTQGAAGIEAKQ